jgi:hypothetical protein
MGIRGVPEALSSAEAHHAKFEPSRRIVDKTENLPGY